MITSLNYRTNEFEWQCRDCGAFERTLESVVRREGGSAICPGCGALNHLEVGKTTSQAREEIIGSRDEFFKGLREKGIL